MQNEGEAQAEQEQALSALRRKLYASVSLQDVIKDYLPSVEFEEHEDDKLAGYCPFHKDRSEYPAKELLVSKKHQMFYCARCEKGGDMFNFIKYAHNLSRDQAILFLARRKEIEIDPLLAELEQNLLSKDIESGESEYSHPLEGIASWEDFLDNDPNSYEVIFLKRLLSSALASDANMAQYFCAQDSRRIKNPLLRSIMSYFAENFRDSNLRASVRTELFGKKAATEIARRINETLPEESKQLREETLDCLLTADPACPNPKMIDLERSFAKIGWHKLRRYINRLDIERSNLSPQDIEDFVSMCWEYFEERGCKDADKEL